MRPLKKNPPVIIFGMHRSGTTLITRLLGGLGVCFGKKAEQNGESVFFLKINQKILKLAGSKWSDPYDFDKNYYLRKPEIISFLSKKMSGFNSEIKYWPDNLDGYKFWGWKDPRNTISLDIWTKQFPDAKLIHIYRNPIDVASSLMVRERRFDQSGKIRWNYNVLKNYLKLGVVAKRAPELIDLQKGIKLWEFYVKRAFNFKNNIYHIKYEDLLDDPKTIMSGLLDFMSLTSDKNVLEIISAGINKKRKYSFLADKELVEAYESMKDDEFLKIFGYNKIV